MAKISTTDDVVRLYDQIGRFADITRFYVDKALDDLVELADFPKSQEILEIGAGTGQFAHRVLSHLAPPSAHYMDIDPSATMRALTTRRLLAFRDRVEICDIGQAPIAAWTGRADRVVATYVLNVLPNEQAICDMLDLASRMLSPSGLLCLANQTFGGRGAGRAICDAWNWIYDVSPAVLGNCRLIDVAHDILDTTRWQIISRSISSRMGFRSEVLVARLRHGN